MAELKGGGEMPVVLGKPLGLAELRHPAHYEGPIYVECWSVDGTTWEVLVNERGDPIVSAGTFFKWRNVWVRWTLAHKPNRIRNVAQVMIDPNAVAWKRRRLGAYTLHGPAAKGEIDG